MAIPDAPAHKFEVRPMAVYHCEKCKDYVVAFLKFPNCNRCEKPMVFVEEGGEQYI